MAKTLPPPLKVNELDNRGTSFYLAMYWAEAMAAHDPSLAALAKDLAANEDKVGAAAGRTFTLYPTTSYPLHPSPYTLVPTPP